jgi:hypothetical protein
LCGREIGSGRRGQLHCRLCACNGRVCAAWAWPRAGYLWRRARVEGGVRGVPLFNGAWLDTRSSAALGQGVDLLSVGALAAAACAVHAASGFCFRSARWGVGDGGWLPLLSQCMPPAASAFAVPAGESETVGGLPLLAQCMPPAASAFAVPAGESETVGGCRCFRSACRQRLLLSQCPLGSRRRWGGCRCLRSACRQRLLLSQCPLALPEVRLGCACGGASDGAGACAYQRAGVAQRCSRRRRATHRRRRALATGYDLSRRRWVGARGLDGRPGA